MIFIARDFISLWHKDKNWHYLLAFHPYWSPRCRFQLGFKPSNKVGYTRYHLWFLELEIYKPNENKTRNN